MNKIKWTISSSDELAMFIKDLLSIEPGYGCWDRRTILSKLEIKLSEGVNRHDVMAEIKDWLSVPERTNIIKTLTEGRESTLGYKTKDDLVITLTKNKPNPKHQ